MIRKTEDILPLYVPPKKLPSDNPIDSRIRSLLLVDDDKNHTIVASAA